MVCGMIAEMSLLLMILNVVSFPFLGLMAAFYILPVHGRVQAQDVGWVGC
jgi:hypothetical protein